MSDPAKREQPPAEDEDPQIFRCWCGAEGTYEELFDESGLSYRCGGTGELHCECGGDLCVCHHHGSVECGGCEDCEEGGYDLDFDEEDCDEWEH